MDDVRGEHGVALIAVVIAELDPAIHPVRKRVLTKRMDPRVKPAGDVAAPHRAGDYSTNSVAGSIRCMWLRLA
jgi:hypothetical protein